jgi:hypothetical protein
MLKDGSVQNQVWPSQKCNRTIGLPCPLRVKSGRGGLDFQCPAASADQRVRVDQELTLGARGSWRAAALDSVGFKPK